MRNPDDDGGLDTRCGRFAIEHVPKCRHKQISTHLTRGAPIRIGIVTAFLHRPAHARVEHRAQRCGVDGREASGHRHHAVGVIGEYDVTRVALLLFAVRPGLRIRMRLSTPHQFPHAMKW